MNYKRGLVSSTLIATALSGVTVFSAHASCENTAPSSRLNPTELSDHGKCWLKKHRPDEESGLAGNLFFIQAPNGDYFSMPVKTLAQMTEEKAVALVSEGVVGMIQQDVEEIGKVAAASQELEDLRVKIDRKQERLKTLREKSSELREQSESLRAERNALQEAVLGDLVELPTKEINDPQAIEQENLVSAPTPDGQGIEQDNLVSAPTPDGNNAVLDLDTPVLVTEETPQEITIGKLEQNLEELEKRISKDEEVNEKKIEELKGNLKTKKDVIERKTEKINLLRGEMSGKKRVIAMLERQNKKLEAILAGSKKQVHEEINRLSGEVRTLKQKLSFMTAEQERLIDQISESQLVKSYRGFTARPTGEIPEAPENPVEADLTSHFETRRMEGLSLIKPETVVVSDLIDYTVVEITPITELGDTSSSVSAEAETCDCELARLELPEGELAENSEKKLGVHLEDNAESLKEEKEASYDKATSERPDIPSINNEESLEVATQKLVEKIGFAKNEDGEYKDGLLTPNRANTRWFLNTEHEVSILFNTRADVDTFLAGVKVSISKAVEDAVEAAQEAYNRGFDDGYKVGWHDGYKAGYRQAEKDYGVGQ